MELQPSPNAYYEKTSIDLLVSKLNKHAATQDYAIVKDRSKISKRNVRMKYWIHCDRNNKPRNEGHGHRNTSSRRIECPFEAIAKLKNNRLHKASEVDEGVVDKVSEEVQEGQRQRGKF